MMNMIRIGILEQRKLHIPSDIVQGDDRSLKIGIGIAHRLQETWSNDDASKYTLVITYGIRSMTTIRSTV